MFQRLLVAEAVGSRPPKNGTGYVIGFANLQRDIPFCALVERGIVANAEAAGIQLEIADNRLDGATALANTESFITRNVDAVIHFQTDAAFGQTIMQKLDEAGIPTIAIDIPMGTATFFGVNNPRAGFMGGSYLAQAAMSEYGAERVKEGFHLHGDLPQSGPIPAMRTQGQAAGFMAAVPDFPADHVLTFDSKNTLDEAFAQVLASEADFVAAVGTFPERYGNALIPMALAELAGKDLPDAVLVNHVMVTKQNVCNFYADVPCAEGEPMAFEFPQAGFEAFLASLRKDPTLADVQNLIPAN